MKKTMKLSKPLLVNDKELSELEYDAEEITAEQFTDACARSASLDKNNGFTFKLRENDYALHLHLGFKAILAVNPSIDITDLERLKGNDLLEVADVGMLFTLRRSGAPSEGKASEVPSETTAEPSTPPSEKSGE